MIHNIALALAVVLIGSADWDLTITDRGSREEICAKSEADCRAAEAAIRIGRWDIGVSHDVQLKCSAHPSCFSDESNRIPGYSGPRNR